jgi:hypothetical protein
MGAAIAILLPPHAAVAGIIADSPYARLDEMIRMIITQILDQKLSRWHGPARAVCILIPALTCLTFLGDDSCFTHAIAIRWWRALIR